MPDPTQPIDCLIEAGWVVPVEPHAVVWRNHAVAIDADRIVAVLPQADDVREACRELLAY